MSTSDEIRKLAADGLTVSEIAKRLSIRYQHAYNVSKQSGLRHVSSGSRATVVQRKPKLMVADLLAAGFTRAGGWQIVDDILMLDMPTSKEEGVYAFATGDVIQYVGVATTGLKGRLYGYSRPGRGQKTNIRVNGLIRDIIAASSAVELLTAVPDAMDWNGLPVHTPAGLELGIIKKYDLPWNVRSSG